MNIQNERRPNLNEDAFRSEICGNLSLPIKDMDALFASGKGSIWPKSNSQQGVILLMLARRYGEWIGVHLLMRESHSTAVHSCIDGLRKRGWLISHNYGQRIIRDGIQCIKSEYQLVFEGGES